MAHELRQLVDTANAPIFGIGKYCTNDPEKLFRDPDLWGLDLVVVETIPTSRELPS